MAAMKSVWLVCWCSWDFEFHEEPRYAFKTQAEAIAWTKKQPEGPYSSKVRKATGKHEGWGIMEVDFA